MMLLGYVIADNKEKLRKIRTSVLITGAVVSAICMFASLFVRLSGLDFSYFLQLVCVFFVFTIGIKHPEWYIVKPFAFLGWKDTFNIYLFHIIVILTLKNILNRLPIPLESLRWILPVASIIGSILLARLLTVIFSKIRMLLTPPKAESGA
jgi:peptidoglycan/LPS O-acetylase OafA/YrhL